MEHVKKKLAKGGEIIIKGKLIGSYICEDNNELISENLGVPDERVYISYGATGEISDDVTTSSDGSFLFNYLESGNYSIFTYADCPTCPTGKTEVKQEISIGKKDNEIELDNLSISIYTKNGCETVGGGGKGGNKSIRGFLNVIYVNENTLLPITEEGMPDARVHIIYDDSSTESDNVRTNYDGSFILLSLNEENTRFMLCQNAWVKIVYLV